MFSKVIRIASTLLVTTVALGTVAAACSNSSIHGIYGFLGSGINGKNQPTASVGQFVATPGTPEGTLVGIQTVSVNGEVGTFPITGTYSVSSNCTGSATVTLTGFKPGHYRIVVVSGGNEIDTVQTDGGVVSWSYSLAQGNATCTSKGVSGKYGFQNTGLVVGTGSMAFTGRLTFEGGNASGTESGSIAGAIFKNIPLSGTYAINSDCTGSSTLTPMGGTTTNFNFVVVNGGDTILAMETDPTTAITGTLKR